MLHSTLALVLLGVLSQVYGVPRVTENAQPSCPRFTTRYEGDSLVIEVEKGECEMVFSSVNMHQENSAKTKSFKKRVKTALRNVNYPSLSFRPLLTISELGTSNAAEGSGNNELSSQNPKQDSTSGSDRAWNPEVGLSKRCTKKTYSYKGPVFVLNTVPTGECQLMVVAHGEKKNKKSRKLNKKGKPRKPRKRVVFEYLDEAFF